MANHFPVNPQKHRCPQCNKPYDFWTQEGRLTGPFHPIGDCKAPRLKLVGAIGCAVCDSPVSESRPGYGKERTCSTRCREVLDEQERAMKRRMALARAAKRSKDKADERARAKEASAEWFEDYKKRKAK